MNQTDFETKWLRKIVRPRGKHWLIPVKDYLVTAALFEYETNRVTIFALQALDYSAENKHWFTFHVPPEEMSWLAFDLEIKA